MDKDSRKGTKFTTCQLDQELLRKGYLVQAQIVNVTVIQLYYLGNLVICKISFKQDSSYYKYSIFYQVLV